MRHARPGFAWPNTQTSPSNKSQGRGGVKGVMEKKHWRENDGKGEHREKRGGRDDMRKKNG